MGIGEACVLGGNQNVAGECHFKTAGDAVAINGADDGATKGFHCLGHNVVGLLGGTNGFVRTQFLQVKTSAESLAIAGKNHDTGIRVINTVCKSSNKILA